MEKLEKIATKDNYWLDAIDSGIQQGVSHQENIDIHAQDLAAKVAVGLVKVKDLRQVVKEARVLHGQAYSYAKGDISSLSGGDLEEAAARRFAHHAMKGALVLVNSWSQRNSFFAGKSDIRSLPDLSGFGNRYLLE